MRSIIITVALVFIVQAAHAEDPCKAHRAKHEESMKGHGMKTDCSNINDDKNKKVVTCTDEQYEFDCTISMGYCWVDGKCYKPSYEPQKENNDDSNTGADAFLSFALKGEVNNGAGNNGAGNNDAGNNNAESRSFGFFPPPPPPQMCRPKPMFPFNCRLGFRDQRLLEPPLDVPYCRRQACKSGNNLFERNRVACMVNPGCYFDLDLFKVRSFNRLAYPGVPICYAAINNPVFQRHANDFKVSQGRWNPTYTQCLIDTYRMEMELEQQRQGGCSMINSLELLHFQPKMAGWSGITRDECLLHVSLSCWHRHVGCVYACKSADNIHVQQARLLSNDRTFYPPMLLYGRSMCQRFPEVKGNDPYRYYRLSTDTFFTAYHRCLAAGCSLDPMATYAYYYYFRNISAHVPQQYHTHFWNNVYSGNCNANNYMQFVEFYQGLPPAAPTFGNHFGQAIGFQPQGNQFGQPNSQFNSNVGFVSVPFSLPVDEGNEEPARALNVASADERTFGFGFQQPQFMRPSCPYQPVQFHGLGVNIKPHSMRTCCDMPMCFHDNMYKSTDHYSGITSYYGPTRWSECSKTCGGGKRTRTRPCVRINGMPCRGDETESQSCNNDPCPKYGNWEAWSECSRSCDGGMQHRTRVCKSISGASCENKDGQGARTTQRCREGNCPTVVEGEWSQCVVSGTSSSVCGKGQRTRTLTCTDSGAYGCPSGGANIETKPCAEYCGRWKGDQRGPCYRCYMTTKYVCKTNDGSEGYCDPSLKPSDERVYCCGGQTWWK